MSPVTSTEERNERNFLHFYSELCKCNMNDEFLSLDQVSLSDQRICYQVPCAYCLDCLEALSKGVCVGGGLTNYMDRKTTTHLRISFSCSDLFENISFKLRNFIEKGAITPN